jgi:1-acyl-sn-glycerol-3-phosphate acyltransferase
MGSTTLRIWRLALYLIVTVALMPVQALGVGFGCAWTATFPRIYHRICCRILGFRVRRIGRPTTLRPALFACNHVSYLDITVLGALIPGSFIAKAEVARWPLFGWLAKLQRSVFVDRQVRSTAAQRDAIAARLAAHDALILFPEGTSSDGSFILPFRSALFSVAAPVDGVPEVAVQPVSITYTKLDGIPIGRAHRPLFAWYGNMAMAPHLWRVVGLGTVEVVVEFFPPTSLGQCGSRKALAAYCEARVIEGVNAALTGRRRNQPPAPQRAPGRGRRAKAPAAAAG